MDRLSALDAEFLHLEDGIAHMHVAGVSVFEGPLPADGVIEVSLPPPPSWTPAPEPPRSSLVLDAWAGLAGDVAAWLKDVPRLVLHPVGALRSGAETGMGLFDLARHLTSTPGLSIEGSIGPHRVWAHTSTPIQEISAVRHTLGGTLNDVVLAAVSGGYRQLLLSRGEDADRAVVRSLVPVSTRHPDHRGETGNRVSAVLLELPVQLADPLDRLAAVRERMAELKQSHMSDTGELMTSVGNLAPPMVVGMAMRVGTRLMQQLPQRSINTVTTNVPGPQYPLYCAGRKMLAYYPYVPISHGVRIATAILSYNGQLAFGITGDEETAPDVDVLASGIKSGLTALYELASRDRRTPLASATGNEF